jgi:phosphate transport system substrate-binding protein
MMLALGTLIAVGTSFGTAAAQERIRISISGSDTMNLLSQRLAEEYMKKHPNVEISVRGGGSGTGIADLMNGLVDIAQSSRKMKAQEVATAKESGYDVKEFIIALDGLAVAVNERNPVEELTVGQIRAIYTGAVKSWNQLDPSFPNAPIVLFSRESNCGTYDFFKEHVLSNSNFAANTSYLAATAAVANSVTKESNAIGYGGVAYFVRPEGLRVLRVKRDRDTPGVSPIDESKHIVNLAVVQDGSYPISRPLHFYTPEEPTGEVKRFMDWVLGPEGQAIVLREEYIPLATGTTTASTQ